MRVLVLAAMLLAVAGCKLAPPGTCESDSQCPSGRVCTNGVCAGCDRDADCHAWQSCAVASRACVFAAGRCSVSSDCSAWQLCDGTHTCVLAPGFCADASGCAAWESCNPSHRCLPQAGRCNAGADCQGWQVCDGSHTCATAPGHCADTSGCASFEDCATDHRCAVHPGRCWTSADCAGFYASCSGTAYCVSDPPGGNDIVLLGNVWQSQFCGPEAIAPVSSPWEAKVGFSCDTVDLNLSPILLSDGTLVYVNNDLVARPVRFVPDAWHELSPGVWTHGKDADPIVPTPGCSPSDPVTGTVAREGLPTFAYECGWMWHDPVGATTVWNASMYAWNASDVFLGDDSLHRLTMWLAGARTPRVVSGLPGTFVLLDARGAGDAFTVALDRGTMTRQQELWRIDPDGVATQVASYGADPPGITVHPEAGGQLDRVGAIYQWGTNDSYDEWSLYRDVVVRFAPDGSVGTIVYRESDAPSPVNSSPDNQFVFIHVAYVFGGP